ncbi:hypothetical protein L9F63_023615, partial [Diploptera punctata]
KSQGKLIYVGLLIEIIIKISKLRQLPPERLVIVDEEGVERTSVVGPYSEGADLALRCDVYG